MIDLKGATRILKSHIDWCGERQPKWKRHRAAYGDDFYLAHERSNSVLRLVGSPELEGVPGTGGIEVTTGVGVAIQVNLLRPLVTSFVAPLGYQGLHCSVEADELVVVEETPEERLARATGVRGLLERWYDTEEIVDTAERLYIMGLLFDGGCALRVGVEAKNDEEQVHILDRAYAEALPPWEVVIDRRSRVKRDHRYIGHFRTVPADGLKGVRNTDKVPIPDVVRDGMGAPRNEDDLLDEEYVSLFDLWDLTEPGGRYACYKVTLESGSMDPVLTPHIKSGPCPEHLPDGRPLVPIVPFVAEPGVEFGSDSFSPIASAYELNAELNRALSVLADAFRRDAARILLYLKDKVDAKTLEAIERSPDMALVGVEAETLEGLFEFLESKPVSQTLLEYIQQILSGLDRTQLTADVTRGKAGNYLSATEAGALVEYSQTIVGRIRKRMDVSLANGGRTMLYSLRQEMLDTDNEPVRIRLGGEVSEVTSDDLSRRWIVRILDTASTPAQKAQKLADLTVAGPNLERYAATLSDPALAGTPSQRMAAALLKRTVEYLDLGGEFSLDQILPDGLPVAPPPQAAPEGVPPEGMPPEDDGGAMPTPEEQQAMLESPEAQALAEAAATS